MAFETGNGLIGLAFGPIQSGQREFRGKGSANADFLPLRNPFGGSVGEANAAAIFYSQTLVCVKKITPMQRF